MSDLLAERGAVGVAWGVPPAPSRSPPPLSDRSEGVVPPCSPRHTQWRCLFTGAPCVEIRPVRPEPRRVIVLSGYRFGLAPNVPERRLLLRRRSRPDALDPPQQRVHRCAHENRVSDNRLALLRPGATSYRLEPRPIRRPGRHQMATRFTLIVCSLLLFCPPAWGAEPLSTGAGFNLGFSPKGGAEGVMPEGIGEAESQ
jgi:hypothetical protein